MSFKILTLNDSEEWNNLLAKLPAEQQDIYYTPEYYSLYENYGDGKAMCFVFEKDGGIALYPFLINSVNALGYDLDKEYFDIQGAYGYNGVVSSSYEPNFIKEFYNEFNSFCADNNIIAEFTRFNPLVNNIDFSKEFLNYIYDRSTVTAEVRGYDSNNYMQIIYTKQGRKDVRKALKQDLIISEGLDENDYIDFYNIYIKRMKEIESASYYQFNTTFFRNIFKFLGEKQKLFLVRNEHNVVVGGIIYIFNGLFAHNFLSASKAEYFKYNINDLLQDMVIVDCLRNKSTKINLGGGNTYKDDDRLLQFKQKFSSAKGAFYIGKKIHNQKIYNEVVRQWETRFPEKVNKLNNILLKYRY
jgi:hypothetical protein